MLDEIDRWLKDPKRVLWIIGEAGVGKSALSASIAARRAEIAAFHAPGSTSLRTTQAQIKASPVLTGGLLVHPA